MTSPTLVHRPCRMDGCDSHSVGRDLCGKHYARWRKFGDPNFVTLRERKMCTVGQCARPHRGHGMCDMHLQRLRKHGDPEYVPSDRRCAWCGGSMAGRKASANTCSVACNHEVLKARRKAAKWEGVDPNRLCGGCGGFMEGKRPHAIYCSRLCKMAGRRTVTLRWVAPKEIGRLLNRQRNQCFYCQVDFGKKYHLDHVVPVSRGGQHSIGNLVAACIGCNLSKNNKFIVEWRLAPKKERR